jgi:hypothetical protein
MKRKHFSCYFYYIRTQALVEIVLLPKFFFLGHEKKNIHHMCLLLQENIKVIGDSRRNGKQGEEAMNVFWTKNKNYKPSCSLLIFFWMRF